ncbi:MAG: glycosyltransferase family 4 protein [Ruminococcus sp.]|uniref:glycosyltransferase family 4 protein n=1 Tax=Ruminococcus sp. TaxID=41978 RepID=UPI0025F679DD|nr:glycosyltransferase family 4 protein [Ruminococcus sp.]MCR5539550.1 glycosyltransferase family 4 protein [Ruminococcus sp.]
MKKNQTVVVLSCHTPSLFWFRMEMMEEFIKRGHKVYALANESEADWADKFAEHGVKYIQIDVQRNGVNPLNDVKAFFSIRKQLKKINPDKIFTFQAKTIIYGTMAANSLGINKVFPLVAGMGSVFLNNDLKSRIIRKIMVLEYKISMQYCGYVFFQNHDDEKIFRDCGIIGKQRIVMLHGSGVNTEKFEVTPLPDSTSFLCISRLIKDKGLYEYLKACDKVKKQFPEIRCMLVGPYDSNPSALKPEELQPYIDNGVIEYFGEQEDVRPYLEQSSVFVLPSYREGTPKTNLEAMASGRAVITTDAPGCKETVINGENGLLVPVKDVYALTHKMIYLHNNRDIIEQMGKIGRRMAVDTFDVKKVNATICNIMNL